MNLKIGQLRKKKSAHNQRVPWDIMKQQTCIVGIPGEETEREGTEGGAKRIFEETMTKNVSI